MADKIVQTAGLDALGEFAPDFAHYNDDVLFGENWNNEDIDLKTRSIITVVALMSQGITDSSLKYHIMNAKNTAYCKRKWLQLLLTRRFTQAGPKHGQPLTSLKKYTAVKKNENNGTFRKSQ